MPGRLVADHRIALFYECRGVNPKTVAALAATDFWAARTALLEMQLCDPARLDATHPRSLGGRPLWAWQAGALSADLHAAARSALAGVEGAAPRWYRLTDQARNLLAGRYRGGGEESTGALRLALTPAALRRLGDRLGGATSLPIAVEDITFHGFRTGIGLVVVLVSLAPGDGGVDADALVEAMPMLADDRRDPCLFFGDGTPAPDRRFQFGAVVDALLAGTGLALERRHRIHSYATLLFQDDLPEDEARDLAHRLSRHYSLAYTPPSDHDGTELLQPFANVLHAGNLEGAATIVTLGSGTTAMPIEFLRDWLSTALRPSYLPIHLLAYHEHLALLDLAQAGAVEIDVDRFSDDELDRLRLLSARFLAFRLRYRIAQPSRITMHNQFYEALQRALGTQALSQKVGRDVAEVEFRLTQIMRDRQAKAEVAAAEAAEALRKLEEQRQKARRHTWSFYGPFAAACVAFVTMLNFSEKLKGLGIEFFVWKQWLGKDGPSDDHKFYLSCVMAGLSVVFAGIAYMFARTHEHNMSHVVSEAEEEAKKEIIFEAGHKPHDRHERKDEAHEGERTRDGDRDRQTVEELDAGERDKQKSPTVRRT
ncbi:MAG: hypothetical protein JNM30_21210 [Rhodospirillales bacterium]|nr:hypothetical protein [Rhodospirillales bacterium]